MKNVFILALLLVAFCIPAKAQYIWVGFGGDWNDPANWFDLGTGGPAVAPPGDADDVIFEGSGGDCVINDNLGTRTAAFIMDISYAGNITNAGGFTVGGSDLMVSGGIFDNTGGGAFSFANITVDGGTLQFGNTSSVTATDISLSSGVLHGGSVSNFTVNGQLNISGGAFTSTSGTLTLNNSNTSLLDFTGGTFTHNGGTVLLDIDNNKQISSGVSFRNLTLRNTTANVYSINFGSGSTSVSGLLTFTVSNTAGAISLIGGGTVNVTGSMTVAGHGGSGTPSHNCTINFNASSGSSTITGNGSSPLLSRAKLPSIAINQTGSATFSMTSNVNVAGNWTFNSSSSVNPNTGTVTFFGASRSINGSGTMTFYNLGIGAGTGVGTGSVSLSRPVTVNNNITIPNSCSFTTTGQNVSVAGFISISSGGTMTANNNTISVGGNFTNAGTLTPGNATFTLTGSNTQSIDFRSSVAITINNLNCAKTSGTASLTDAVSLSGTLTCTGGTLNTNGNLTLLSTAAGTSAQVGNSTGGTYTGSATIQRFIPSVGRRWRFLAAPVLSGSTISNSWQQQMFITGAGTGSGPVGTANYNSNGFDWTPSNAPTMYTYNEAMAGSPGQNDRWETPASTSVTLNAGTGYRIFVRGGRSSAGRLDGSLNTQDAITLSVSGTIPSGNQNVSISCSNGCVAGTDGWNLVGNPYPATIDWNSFRASNSSLINGTYYVLNPSTNVYDAWNGTTGSAGRYISSGQAFWVEKSGSGTTNMTFSESHKSSTQAGGALFKTESEPSNLLKIKLNGTSFSNETFVHMNGTGQYAMDAFDAYKLSFASYQVATFDPSNTTRLDINNLPEYGNKAIDTIEVDVKLPVAAANYSLSFSNVASFDNDLTVVLEDKLNNTFTDLKVNSTYSFSANGNANSVGNRFRILVSNPNNPLPVNLVALQARLNSSKTVDLTWSTISEKNNAKFIVEHSLDGKQFKQIGVIKGAGNSSTLLKYAFVDASPNTSGLNYYRLRQVDYNGKYTYSNVCFVSGTDKGVRGADENASGAAAVALYPVPAKDVLNITGVTGETCTVSVSGMYGDQVLTQRLSLENGQAVLNIESLKTGLYVIDVTDGNGIVSKLKFIKE